MALSALPVAVRVTVTAVALAGSAALVLTGAVGGSGGLGSVVELVAVGLALATSMAAPMYVLRDEETEDVAIDEAFLVVLILLFPPVSTVVVFAVATLAVNLMLRRSGVKLAFNVGQMALAAAVAAGVAAGLGGADAGPVTSLDVFTATVAAATFFVVNQMAMTAILVVTGATRLQDRLGDIVRSTLPVSVASTALGLLAAVAGAAQGWSLLLALIPLAVLRMVLARTMHAQQERNRVDDLLGATTSIHRSLRLGDVRDALVERVKTLLVVRHAEIRLTGPGFGELGACLQGEGSQWLIAASPKSVEGFTPDDQRLLDALAALASDAFENARLVEEIHHQAFHDPLTDLPNRVLFEERLRYVLQQSTRSQRSVGVLFVDLDRFKKVNDTLGHEAGNEVLQVVASRLCDAVRPGDVVARNGGDEFTVLLADLARWSDAVIIAERILDAMTEAFVVGEQQLFVTASIGIATHPPADGDAGVLLRQADLAMYRAKDRGRNTYQLYTPSIAQAGADRLTLEADLHTAVTGDGLSLEYQPQVDLATGRVVGVEALVRWVHPTLGAVSPARFVPLAEETGLIRDIDRWVLREALRQLRQWIDEGLAPMKMAVNLSGHDVQEPHFVDRVAESLAGAGVAPHFLELEITESVALRHGDGRGLFHELKDLGCRLAIDDFGTGYSMLTRLREFPLDKLKIDKSFVADIRERDGDAPIVAALVGMAHGLGLEVCAEGVETAEQWHFLDRHRCDLVQGYYASRPVAAEKISAMMTSENAVLHLP